MERFSNAELNIISEKVRKVVKQFDITVKVSEPDRIWLLLPSTMHFPTHHDMAEMAQRTLAIAGVRLHLDLEVMFMQNDKYLCTIILHGIPKSEFN